MCLHAHAQVSYIQQRFRSEGFHQYQCESLDFYTTGQQKFDALMQDIASAHDYIHIEYYKFWNDSIGRIVMDALAQKAQQGLEVKVLYDDFGNNVKKANCTKEFLQHYRSLGVDIRAFSPLKFPYINHIWPRLHRKMVVIDGRVLYTGGMNIADYYIKGRPDVGRWCDVHARVTGTLAQGYDSLFVSLWYRKFPKDFVKRYITVNGDGLKVNEGQGCPAYLVDRRPGAGQSADIRKSYKACFDGAQKSIRLINPYIMPIRGIRRHLVQAIKRGVSVEIVLSLHGDGVASEAITSREVHYLQRHGAKVWLYKPGFHHDKIMVVDDTLCTIGTANLDARSLAFDYEVNGYYISTDISKALTTYFEEQKAQSVQLTESNYKTLYSSKVRRRGRVLNMIKFLL